MDNLQEILSKISNIQAKYNSELDELKIAIIQLASIPEAAKTPTKEERLAGLLSGLNTKKLDNYPNSLFYMRGDDFIFEQDSKNMYFCVSYRYIWSIFESEFGMEYNAIQAFIGSALESMLKVKGFTTWERFSRMSEWLESMLLLSKENLNGLNKLIK